MKLARRNLIAASIFTIGSVLLGAAPAANASTIDVASLWASIDTSTVATTPQNAAIGLAAWQEVNASSDPASVLATLSPTQLADLKVYLTPTGSVFVPAPTVQTATSSVTTAIATTTTCRQANGYFTEVNGYGTTLWVFKTTGGWCSNGTSVTSASYIGSYATVDFIGWFYDGVIGHSSGVIGGSGRSYSQGKFQLVIAGIVVQQVLPCNRVVGFANGSYVADNTCGLS